MVSFENSIVGTFRVKRKLAEGDTCPTCETGTIRHWRFYEGHDCRKGHLFCSGCGAIEENWEPIR